jgi:alkanesulfonate monooxygenase SsuD/methylene tetrahydromethanopterin reductase-like flavin-dependent oxidoreductase (luciferase family)
MEACSPMSSSRVPLSVLDLAPVVSGQTAADALANSVDLAQQTERFGYHRYWVAEHHLVPGVAAASPAVLIALLASATTRLRIGSGAVLLGYYPPLTVAEQFGTIAQLHPGRIDLGLGRSGFVRVREFAKRFTAPSGAPAPEAKIVRGLVIPGKPTARFDRPEFIDRFEERQRLLGAREDADHDYSGQVCAILDFLAGTYVGTDGEPLHATPAKDADLEVWVLGSSAGESAKAAGELGLPFTANYHVSPSTVLDAVDAYRAAFTPSARLAEPWVMVSADVVVAETEDFARELASPYAAWVHSIRGGQGAIEFPTPAEAEKFAWTEESRAMVDDRVATQFVGTPDSVVDRLETLRAATGADELLVTTITHDHADRVRSFDLLARAWNSR